MSDSIFRGLVQIGVRDLGTRADAQPRPVNINVTVNIGNTGPTESNSQINSGGVNMQGLRIDHHTERNHPIHTDDRGTMNNDHESRLPEPSVDAAKTKSKKSADSKGTKRRLRCSDSQETLILGHETRSSRPVSPPPSPPRHGNKRPVLRRGARLDPEVFTELDRETNLAGSSL